MTTYWLARDEKQKHDGSYRLYKGEQPFKVEGMWASRTKATQAIAMLCPRAFVRVTGIYIRKGRCLEVKVTRLKRGFKFELVRKGSVRMSNKLPWCERINMLAVNPDAANRDDVAKLASELGDCLRLLEIIHGKLEEFKTREDE